MNSLMKFEGFPVEVIEIDGQLMFELYSTGAALGYVKSNGYSKFPRKDRINTVAKNAEITPCVHSGHSYLTEPQLYDFMLEARTDKCRTFRKWVTNEVLPSIRQTGQYAPQQISMIHCGTYKGQTVMTFAEIEAVSGIPQWYSRDFVLNKCRRGIDFIVLRGEELMQYKAENCFQKENVNALAIVSQRCICKLYEVYKTRNVTRTEKRIEAKKQPSKRKTKVKIEPADFVEYVRSMTASKREKFVGSVICSLLNLSDK